MKKLSSILYLIIFLSAVVTSCSYDKEELLYSNTICQNPPQRVSYALDVLPVLQQNCYSCHAVSNPPGGNMLGDYTNDRNLALSGKMYGAIAHQPGFLPMPFGQAKLPACTIAAIKKWIDDGALNN
jgi:hypothetical protein